MANQSKLNMTEVDPDVRERERKMNEVEAMLTEMRNRSSSSQRKMADREKSEADKRNLDSYLKKKKTSKAKWRLGGNLSHLLSSFSARSGQQASSCTPAGDQ